MESSDSHRVAFPRRRSQLPSFVRAAGTERAVDRDRDPSLEARIRVGGGAGSAATVWLRAASPALVNAATLPLLAACVEAVLVALVTFEAGRIYHQIQFGHLPYAGFYLMATLALAVLFVAPAAFRRDYSLKRLLDRKEQVRSAVMLWNTVFSLFILALFLTHSTDFYSRGSILIQYVIGLAAVVGHRLVLTQLAIHGLEKGRLAGKQVLVIGAGAAVSEVLRRLRGEPQGAEVIGAVRLGSTERREPREAADDIRAAVEAACEISRRTPIDEIVVALPWGESERIRALVERLAVVPASIHLAPDPHAGWTREPVVARVGRLPMVRLSRAPLTLRDRAMKRLFDLAVGSLLLLIAAPLFAVVAVLIKLDSPGPVFFRQRRNGFNQQEFRIFKFRTMTTLDDGPVIRQATRNDQRITRIGKFLRSTNLDELPQLLNVLRGEMSLVGPRPHAVAHNNEYEEKVRLYARRHNVKPGITGWSQVNGLRGETDSLEKMRQRVEHDLHYIDHWSLLFDVKIMLMTVFSPRSYRNAY